MAEIPPPPQGYALDAAVPPPPAGYELDQPIPPPPPGYTLDGQQGPSLLAKVGHLAMKAITPIPVLQQAVDKGVEAARGLADAARPDVVKDTNAAPGTSPIMQSFQEAAKAARDATIPLPSADLTEGAIRMAVPTAPLDIAAQVGGPLAGMAVSKAVDAAASKVSAAMAAELGSDFEAKTFRTLISAEDIQKGNLTQAIRNTAEARDQAFREVNAARKAVEDHVAQFGDVSDPAMRGRLRERNRLVQDLKRRQDAAWALKDYHTALQDELTAQPPHIEPDKVATPQMTSPFPQAASKPAVIGGNAVAGARVTPEAVSEATKYINPERMTDETAAEVITSIANDPTFQAKIVAQKGGVVPRAQSRAAGRALGATKEEFAALEPRQGLGRGTLDAQTTAASAMQNKAAADFYKLAQQRAQGAPLEQVSKQAALNLEAIIGAQGVISETGRALGAISRTPAERALIKIARSNFHAAMTENPAALDAFLKEMAALPTDAIAQQIVLAKKFVAGNPNLWDMAREVRQAMLLTNPATAIRNTAGNMLAVMSNLTERPVAGMADFLYSAATGTPQQVYLGEGMANAVGMWGGIKSSAREALNVLRGEAGLSGFGTEFALQQGAVPGKVGTAIRTPFRILNATDTFFKGILGHAELNRLAFKQAASEGLTGVARAKRIQELVANPTQDMAQSIIKTAQEFTFQTPLEGSLKKFEDVLNQSDAIGFTSRFVIPFFRTPVNIAKFAIERAPILDNLTSRGLFREAFLNSGAGRQEVMAALSRNVTGAMAVTSAAIALHANEGRITGAPPKDKADRENLYATGWRPYSIKIGGQYVSYRGLEPLASYLGAVADWSEMARKNPEMNLSSKAVGIMQNVSRNFLNQPFLKGLADMLDVIEDPGGPRTQALAGKLTGSMVPAGLNAIAVAKDKTLRDPEGFLEQIMARTPVLSERVRPKLSRLGEPIYRTTYAFGLLDQPLPVTNKIERELRTLGIPQAVGFPDRKLGDRMLTKDEYNEYLSTTGPVIKERVEKVMEHPDYSKLPLQAKADIISKFVQDARSQQANLLRPRAELRALGITEKLAPEELLALNARITIPDYRFMKDKERKQAVSQFLANLRASKQR